MPGGSHLLNGVAATVLLWASPAPAAVGTGWFADLPPGAYALEPERSSLAAYVSLFGIARYGADFTRLEGRVLNSPGRTPQVSVRIDPRSIDHPDAWLGRSMLQMLEPERFPAIGFVSRDVVAEGGRTWLVGDLTLHGITRPVRLAIRFDGAGRPDGARPRPSFSGTATIRRSDFAMGGTAIASDRIELRFKAVFRPLAGDTADARSAAPCRSATLAPARASICERQAQ